ncbi:hypothetical protein [Nibricoccus sp. IMCC34717]|uniref:hypothetical protein n=1 Tax=Nibricoccus sp. IMCC34717 TaxID=3034021 RepID=UPI00384D503F
MKTPKRFFSDDSFWNQPIGANPKIDGNSERWIETLCREPAGPFWGINTEWYTIPVYEADANTPRHTIHPRPVSDHFKFVHGHLNKWFDTHEHYGHGPGFGQNVPIPVGALMDPQEDAHIVVVDWGADQVWDVWGMEQRDGKYYSFTGMTYKASGRGVFDPKDFTIKNGESVHFHGPGRAAGVPVIAGLVLYDEVQEGAIRHKLAGATRFNAYQESVYPAIWTDGILPGSIPEGAVVQLDPDLDLYQFDLTREERIVARAAQEYGIVIVDNGGSNCIYAQGLYGDSPVSWKGKIRGWSGGINNISMRHYRVIQCPPRRIGGLNPQMLDGMYFQVLEPKPKR